MNHVSIALGSHGELWTCVELAKRLGFLSADDQQRVLPLIDSVGRLLYGLYNSLERKGHKP
jgi:four helix bundle protein